MKNKYLAVIFSFCLILAVLLTAVDFWCFNRSFYSKEYSELNTAENIGLSKEDLEKVTDVLLSYLKDRDLSLDIKAKVKGVQREIFNDREKAHMVDVRELYLNAMLIRNISVVLAIISFVVLIIRKESSSLYPSFIKVLIFYVVIFAIIGLCCLIDFDAFWTTFHHIFFPDNDLWLLDPRKDILIMMVPSKFFFDLCLSIVITILLAIFALFIFFYFIEKRCLF